jgi:initiation factor 1A
MVKNTTGGKNKNQARKHSVQNRPVAQTLRTSNDALEVYAQVTKALGNGMCHVYCMDKQNRLCHIRGKFSGRGKRDNFIAFGTWLLVGLREWESSSVGKQKQQHCDLMEVYNDQDKERLKSMFPDLPWKLFSLTTIATTARKEDEEDDFEFMDKKKEEYFDLLQTIQEQKEIVKPIAFENIDNDDNQNSMMNDFNIDDI